MYMTKGDPLYDSLNALFNAPDEDEFFPAVPANDPLEVPEESTDDEVEEEYVSDQDSDLESGSDC